MTMRTLLILTTAIGAAILTTQGMRWRSATAAEAAAVARLQRTADDAAKLITLSARSERIALTERPPQDLIARLRTAITDSDISATLEGVQPESSSPIRSSRRGSAPSQSDAPQHRRQAARATLRSITLEDLGRLLAHWRQTQALWSISNITLTHDGSQDPRGLYRVELTLAATYLGDGSP